MNHIETMHSIRDKERDREGLKLTRKQEEIVADNAITRPMEDAVGIRVCEVVGEASRNHICNRDVCSNARSVIRRNQCVADFVAFIHECRRDFRDPEICKIQIRYRTCRTGTG